jgi:hypothetical protein
MAIDGKINNIIGSKLPQWLLNQLHKRSNENSRDKRNTNDNILYLGNKSSWVRLISSVNITDPEDIKYFKDITGADIDAITNESGQIKNESDLSKKYILYGGTSKYLQKGSYGLRSGLGKDNAYGMLGDAEIKKYGYKPMPGITSATIETQGRLGSLRAATINFKCWDKNQLDIIDTLYFKLGFTMFLEWGHTYFYPSETRSIADSTITLQTDKIYSTELFAIDPFEANLTKEQIFSRIAKNSRATEGNYDAMLGICTNFTFSYTQDGGYDCTLKIMSLGILGDSIKINNSGTLPNLLEEEIKLYNNTLAKIDKAKKDAEEAAKRKALQEATEKKSSDISTYPDCIRNIPNAKGLNINPYPTPRYFFPYGFQAVIVQEGVTRNHIYYNDGRYQTQGLNGSGTYECKNDGLYLNGVKVVAAPLLSQLPLDEYINVAVRQTETDNALARAGNRAGTPLFTLFPSDKAETTGPNFVGADRYSKFPISNAGYQEGFLVNRLSGVIPNSNPNFKVKLDYTKFLGTYAKFKVGNAQIADYFTNASRWTDEFGLGDSMYIELEYTSQYSNNEKYKIKTTVSDNVTAGKVDAIDSNGLKLTNGAGNIVQAQPEEKDEYNTTELQKVINKITQDLASPTELFNLVSATTIAGKGNFKIIISKNIPVTFKVNVTVDSYVDGSGKTIPTKEQEQEVEYNIPVTIEFNDSYIIQGLVSPPDVIQPGGFSNYEDPSTSTTTTTTTAAPSGGGGGGGGEKSDPIQTKQSITSQSSLELILRSIQVHVINQTLVSSNINKIVDIDLITEKSRDGKQAKFLKSIFSIGVMSKFIDDIISQTNLDISTYDTVATEEQKFKINTYYGYATNLMANNVDITAFKPNNFRETLRAFSLPYQVDQEIIKGTSVNRPVYIPLGFLLMIINNVCGIYDTNKDFQTPLVYIDFNNNHNFFLSTAKHLSIDGFNVLIPFEGTNDDYKSLFDSDILEGYAISPISGSKDGPTPLFNPGTADSKDKKQNPLSASILPVKYDKINSNTYRGKIMNVLISIDYLTQLVEDYSYKDGSNNVYLKPFLEQVLVKINKSLGDFNALRLAYNDQGNCFQIIDDQFIPSPDEDQVYKNTRILDSTNRTELPLLGKKSIAKSLEIKTDVSSKLANMIAISSNSTVKNKSTLSTNGDNFGYLNTNFIDRYIPDKLEVTGSNQNSKQYDTLKIAAKHFNQTVIDFYVTGKASQGNVADATNYYIEKLSKNKNEDPATRASAPIPLSISFLTDGISGMSMGNAFTVPQELLPYTYGSRKIGQSAASSLDNVGFIVVGLSHTIENNSWNTNVRGIMYYLKDSDVFNKTAIKAESNTLSFSGGSGGGDFIVLQGDSEIYYLANLAHNMGDCGAEAILKAAKDGIVHMDERDPNYRNICASNIQRNMFGVQDPRYANLNRDDYPGNVGNFDFEPELIKAGANTNPLYTPSNFLTYKKAKFKPKYEDGQRYSRDPQFAAVIALIEKAAIDYNVPLDFLFYVAYSESGFKANSDRGGRYKGLFGSDSLDPVFTSGAKNIFNPEDHIEFALPRLKQRLPYAKRLKKWIDNNYQGSPGDNQYES